MALQQLVPIVINLQGDGVSTVFRLSLSAVYQIGDSGSIPFLPLGVIPSSAFVNNTHGQIILATVDTNGNVTITFDNPPQPGLPQRFDLVLVYDSGDAVSASPLQLAQPVRIVSAATIGTPFSVNTGTTPVLVDRGVRQPILSIQPSPGLSPPTSLLFTLFQYRLAGNGATALYELVLNGNLTGASFSPVALSNMTVDTSATVISGGKVVDSGYLTLRDVESTVLTLGFNFTNTMVNDNFTLVGDIFTLVLTPMGAKNSLSAAFNWVEGGD